MAGTYVRDKHSNVKLIKWNVDVDIIRHALVTILTTTNTLAALYATTSSQLFRNINRMLPPQGPLKISSQALTDSRTSRSSASKRSLIFQDCNPSSIPPHITKRSRIETRGPLQQPVVCELFIMLDIMQLTELTDHYASDATSAFLEGSTG
jgi:hypothetical protein